jgi:outer membrane protein assembly factor BamB
MPAVRPAKLLLPVILAVALLSSACVGFSEPRGWAEPVFDGETVYVFVDRDEFAAVTLDEFGGQALWVFPDGDLDAEKEIDLEAVYGPPLFAGERIILAGFSGEMVALGLEGRYIAGRGSWHRADVDGSIVGGATLAGDRFIFGTTEQRLYVRSVVDGGAVAAWPLQGRKVDGEIWSQPVVVGNVFYVGTMTGKLYAFDLATGAELWERPFDADGAIADLSYIGNDTLFVPTLRGEVWLVDAATGTALGGAYETEGWVWTRPVIQGGVAYFGDFDGFVYAMDLETRRTLWTYAAEDKVKAQGVIIGDTLIVGDEGGTVHFVDVATGLRRNAVKLDGAGKIRAGLVEKAGFAWILGTEGRLYRAEPETLQVFEREVRGLP